MANTIPAHMPGDSTVEYHAPMLAVRIKQRPILFSTWFLLSALLLASLSTFITGFGYFGNTKQVMFVSGGLLIQSVAPKTPDDCGHLIAKRLEGYLR